VLILLQVVANYPKPARDFGRRIPIERTARKITRVTIDGRLREPVARLLGAIAAVLFAIDAVLVWTRWPPLLRLDARVATDLHGFAGHHPGLVTALRLVSSAGTTFGWLVMLSPLVFWLCYRREFRLAGYVVATPLLSSLLNTVIKAVFKRPRPSFEDPLATGHGTSFPSGHAQAAVVGVGLILLVLAPRVTRWVRAVLVLLGSAFVLLIGLARITLGVHYLSDVVGGYLLGAAFLLGTACLGQARAWVSPELLSPAAPRARRQGGE
jgi:undecaprenyl-diphosphatase